MIPTLIITLLIVANGLFVAAEFAIIVARRTTLEGAAARGDRLAKLILRTKTDARRQDRYIAAAQLGITLASLALGMYGEHLLAEKIAHWLHETPLNNPAVTHTLATIIAISILTYFHIVVGEMVPKSLALGRGMQTARFVIIPMLWFEFLMFPFVAVLNGIGNGILRMFRIDRAAGEHHSYSVAELGMVVQESKEGGLLGTVEADILHELIDFSDLDAKEVMVPRIRVTGIDAEATWEDVRRTISEKPHTRYPVYQKDLDHIVGVLHIKDVLRFANTESAVSEALDRSVPVVPETAPLSEVLARMNEHRTQLAVVLDEYGGTAGIVTINDLQEEIVGQIDEPLEQRAYVKRGNAIYADGTLRLDETGELLDLRLVHPEVDTIGGLVQTVLNRAAEPGDQVEYEGVIIRVVQTDGRSITRCQIRRKR